MHLLKPIIAKLTTSALETQRKLSEFKHDCEACLDTGWVVVEGKGAHWCECFKSKRYARLIDRIPPEYRLFTLENILPDISRHEKQVDLFAAAKADPSQSFLLSGRVGCGKSLVGWLLYREAIEQGRPVVAMTLAELLAQIRKYECGSNELPAITADSLRDDTCRWFVFLDEFDKARPSEFACEQLFLLVDAIYTFRHQLVITSNLDKDELRAHWSKASEQYGASIMRRVIELDGLTRVELF
jgi:DNA replication protein DnaC